MTFVRQIVVLYRVTFALPCGNLGGCYVISACAPMQFTNYIDVSVFQEKRHLFYSLLEVTSGIWNLTAVVGDRTAQ